MALHSYKELIVWQKSINLTTEVYRLTALYPKSEIFGLVSQSRRAVVSIPSNIAEGYARKNNPEYSHFINIAYASGAELETQLVIAENLRFAETNEFKESTQILQEILRMLNVLERKIRSR